MLTLKNWILFFFFFCFLLKALILDPDLGWHLVNGGYILSFGIPATDPFSYSMPSYQLVMYSWFTDVVLFVIHDLLGMYGLAFLFALLGIASMWVLLHKERKLLTVPLLLSGSTLLFVMGIRPQVVSWVLFAVLLVVLTSKRKYAVFFVPAIFLLWANMHSSFVLGLVVLTVYIVTNIIQTKKLRLTDVGVGIASLLATFVTPYGVHLWEEIFRIVNWPEKHSLLLDWYPGLFVPYIPFWIFTILSVFFLIRYHRRYSLFEQIVFVLLLGIGLSAIIDIPYFILFSLPLLVRGFVHYQTEKSGHHHKKPFLLSNTCITIICVCIFIHGLLLFYNKPYPQTAVTYLQQHTSRGNIFTEFDWGGYLLWQLPQKKVFVNGQMPHWQLANPSPNESGNAFEEYRLVMNGKKSLSEFAVKYKIDTLVLQPAQSVLFTKQLQDGKWREVYKDRTSVIYQK